MDEWICLKCRSVFCAGKDYAKCCGEGIEPFDPGKHGRLLIGLSNSWVSVHEMWKENPLLSEISQELYEDGCYGAAVHLNTFIERLYRHYIRDESEMSEWISVKDRLPEVDEDILSFNNVAVGEDFYTDFGDERMFYSETVCPEEVTHWMPLPDPPKDNITIRLESLGYGDVDYKTSYNAGEATFE